MKVAFYTLGKWLLLSIIPALFLTSSLSALDGNGLYYEAEEIVQLQSLKLDGIIYGADLREAVDQYQRGAIHYRGISGEKIEAESVHSPETGSDSGDETFDEKRDYFKEIINGKEKAKKLLQMCHLSLQNHDWSEAIRTATEAIAICPDYADAYSNRAWGYYEKGLLDKSIKDCNKALAVDENHFFALNNRGRAFQKKGDMPRALKDYDAACQKGLEVACENFKKITRLSPEKGITFLLDKSREDFVQGNLDGVIEASTRLIALNAHTKEAYSKRCRAYVMKNMFAIAHNDCKEAILRDPDQTINYINLGAIFEQQENIPAALQNYRISCELKNSLGCQNYQRLSARQ